MNLTMEECGSLVDSRLVDLENAVKTYKDNEPIVNNAENLNNLQKVIDTANALYDAYDAKVQVEEDNDAEELSKEYGIDMTAGLDEALSIRNDNGMRKRN